MPASCDIPKYQRAIIITQVGEKPLVKVVDDYPVPEVGYGEILVRLTSSGVCHSDLSVMTGHWGIFMNCKVGGHEGSGYIVKHGEGTDSNAYPLGLKVGVPLICNPCRSCHACGLNSGETLCSKTPYYGTNIDGTWQQYTVIKESYIIPIPESIPDEKLYKVGPVLCGGVTAYKALKVSQKAAGAFCVITGAGGGLGSLGIQYAREMGMRVIAVDTGDDKRELSISLGAEFFIDFMRDDIVQKVKELTANKGADASIMLAPNIISYNQAIDYLGLNGTLVCIGLPDREKELHFPPYKLIYTGITIKGSLVGTRTDILEALDFVARKKVNPSVTMRSMDDIQEVIDDMLSNKIVGRVVIDLN